MPLDIRRLLTSETWIEAAEDPRIGHAALSLWAESWHQVPAGSLPNNERVLQRLSMCPTRDEWLRIRDRVMAGWVVAEDGLLYHPVVCEKALEAWTKKLEQRERTRKATEAREQKRREREEAAQRERDEQRDVVRDVVRDESRDVHQGTGTGTGTGTGNIKTTTTHAPAHTHANTEPATTLQAPERRGGIAKLLRDKGIQCTYSHPIVVQWAQDGITDETICLAIESARLHKPPPEPIPLKYLDPIVQRFATEGVHAPGFRASPASQRRDQRRAFIDELTGGGGPPVIAGTAKRVG